MERKKKKGNNGKHFKKNDFYDLPRDLDDSLKKALYETYQSYLKEF